MTQGYKYYYTLIKLGKKIYRRIEHDERMNNFTACRRFGDRRLEILCQNYRIILLLQLASIVDDPITSLNSGRNKESDKAGLVSYGDWTTKLCPRR